MSYVWAFQRKSLFLENKFLASFEMEKNIPGD